jgi:predicted flap endonuclease-1-like 5' DNA nuclease
VGTEHLRDIFLVVWSWLLGALLIGTLIGLMYRRRDLTGLRASPPTLEPTDSAPPDLTRLEGQLREQESMVSVLQATLSQRDARINELLPLETTFGALVKRLDAAEASAAQLPALMTEVSGLRESLAQAQRQRDIAVQTQHSLSERLARFDAARPGSDGGEPTLDLASDALLAGHASTEPLGGDNLERLPAVGRSLARILNELDITTFRQIATLDIDNLDERLAPFVDRIRRDGWIERARQLHAEKYQENLP